MSTLTKEWLLTTIAELEEERDAVPGVVNEDAARALAAMKLALASLEAEPVAYMYKDNLHSDARFSLHTIFGNWSQEDINEYEITEIPLYAAPPVPVSVPDLKPVGFLFVSDDGAVAYSPADWPMKGFNLIGQIYGDLNACRAAMLQGAERVSNRDELPDGWVACSERMPERDVDVQIYCADKKEQMVGYMERNEQGGYFRFASLPNGGGVYCKPTHWMPLPAAPRQEV